MSHHDTCGACARVSTAYTPAGFPQPGEVAESITRTNPSHAKLHRLIAEAVAERDHLWVTRRRLARVPLPAWMEEPWPERRNYGDPNPVWRHPVRLSVRTLNALVKAFPVGTRWVDVVQHPHVHLLKQRGFGSKSLRDLVDVLLRLGLAWPRDGAH